MTAIATPVSFENLVNYDKSKTVITVGMHQRLFENLVNYDKSKTSDNVEIISNPFENLVNYDKSKTVMCISAL